MGEQISLCGKLEAIIGGYFLSGAGLCQQGVETLYYDSSVGKDDTVELIKENIVAYFLADERMALVKHDMFQKLKHDTEGYNISLIAVEDFDSEVLKKEDIMPITDYYIEPIWIDDDFMRDETIPFDFDAFEVIDSGVKYLNPKHFSVRQLVAAIDDTSV